MISLLKISILLAGTVGAQAAYHATTGGAEATYAHRLFHDFRSLDDTGNLYSSEPSNITSDEESSAAPVQPGYLSSDAFVNDWGIQTWDSPAGDETPLRKQYSNQNVYIQRDGDTSETHLVLRAYRNKDFVSAGEIDSKLSNILHASIRVRARVRGESGACAGIFTYFDDDNESDIEILTRDPTNHIRYTNQPGLDSDGNEIPEASTDAVMQNGAVCAWYLNEELAETKTYGIPRSPSSVILNMWSDGGVWSGEMSVGSAAYLEIQWIEILFNTSS